MCGIAGIFRWDRPADLQKTVEAMTSQLAHRGPDGSGVQAEPGVALGHRRLSIIDLSDRAAQPMTNEDGTVWLTFNGEIYNHVELRRSLESGGHRFRSHSDSEVLLHLYEASADEPERFLDAVRGMFAFAIWDGRMRRLVIARDRLGIKPLVYFQDASRIAFASDVDALTACPDVPRRLDWTSLYEYLLLMTVPGPHTILRDVMCLEPGTMRIVENGSSRDVAYWRLGVGESDTVTGEADADELIESCLADAVSLHLVADVDVGAFLSGGIDSGLVSSFAAQSATTPLRTFAATFPGESVDEGPWARDFAQQIGTAHTEFDLAGGFLDGIADVVGAMDQPLGLTSAVSLFHLSRLARQRVKVVLTGDGGDETFGGYARHRPYPTPARAAWIPESVRPAVGRFGSAVLPAWARKGSGPLGRAAAFSSALARDEAERYVPRLFVMLPEEALAMLPADGARQVDAERYLDRVRRLFGRCQGADQLTRMLFVDLQTTLVDEMLAKVDRMTMAWGLEARVPFLDHRVVEASMRIAGALKRCGEMGKLPLRRLVRRRLGHDAAGRPKSGFNSPLGDWLVEDSATRLEFESLWERVCNCPVLDARAARRMRDDFHDGGLTSSSALFSVSVFALWMDQRGGLVA